MRRDVRRFVFFRWKILEIPDEVPIDLTRAWRQIHGFLPPWGFGAVAGYSFRLEDGVRGFRITRPEPLQIREPIERRLATLLRAKHRVEVRLALPAEIPDLVVPDRLPESQDWKRIKQWPSIERPAEALVAELATTPGVYISESSGWGNTSGSLDDAILFDDAAEAEQYLATLGSGFGVTLRYRSACLAESDQREAASIDGKAMMF